MNVLISGSSLSDADSGPMDSIRRLYLSAMEKCQSRNLSEMRYRSVLLSVPSMGASFSTKPTSSRFVRHLEQVDWSRPVRPCIRPDVTHPDATAPRMEL